VIHQTIKTRSPRV